MQRANKPVIKIHNNDLKINTDTSEIVVVHIDTTINESCELNSRVSSKYIWTTGMYTSWVDPEEEREGFPFTVGRSWY